MTLKFGDMETITKLKKEAATQWVSEYFKDILSKSKLDENLEHSTVECSECGHERDCEGDDLGAELIKITDKAIVIKIYCRDCGELELITIYGWGESRYRIEKGNTLIQPEDKNQLVLAEVTNAD